MSTDVTIYHNPRCSTSRNALALLQERGIEPRVIEYLKTPPGRAELKAIAKATGEPLRALVRAKQAEYAELGLDGPVEFLAKPFDRAQLLGALERLLRDGDVEQTL